MTFPSAKLRVPTTIATITADFSSDGTTTTYRARLDVLDQNGATLQTLQVDLLPYLTAGQKTAIDNFMAALRTKASTELLA